MQSSFFDTFPEDVFSNKLEFLFSSEGENGTTTDTRYPHPEKIISSPNAHAKKQNKLADGKIHTFW